MNKKQNKNLFKNGQRTGTDVVLKKTSKGQKVHEKITNHQVNINQTTVKYYLTLLRNPV